MKIVAFILALLFLASCSHPFGSDPKCPCNVKIAQLQEDGTYRMEVVKLQTLENPRKIRSSKIQITLEPHFYTDGSVDEVTPEAQFIVDKDGVIIPTQTQTSEMFSIYKTMEDLYFFDVSVGIDNILTYPRVVSLQTHSNITEKKNDAKFSPIFDRIAVLKYIGEKTPLAINMGVLAHEHFHAFFNKIVDPIRNTTKSFRADDKFIKIEHITGYNYLILKALDEGLADFWANIHTGLVNPYISSYSQEENVEGRVVVPRVFQMDDQESLESIFDLEKYTKEEKLKDRQTHGYVYGKGVMYSNLLKSISEKVFNNPEMDLATKKILTAQWIIASVQKLSKVVEAKGKTVILTQADILDSFVPENLDRESLSEVCADFNLFLYSHPDKVPSCSGH